MDQHQEDEEVIDDTNTDVNSDNLMKARVAFQIFCRGLLKLVQFIAYSFVAFSVWFTIRAALCSLVVVDQNRGCAASLRNLLIDVWRRAWAYCISRDLNIFRQVGGLAPNLTTCSPPQWTLAVRQSVTDFLKATAVIVGVYWARFWGVHTYRMELPRQEGGGLKDRLMLLINALREATVEQADEFRTYLLVISVSAFAFAVAFAPLIWMVHLLALNALPALNDLAQEEEEESCVVASSIKHPLEVSWMTLVLKQFWMLFMVHFITSASVADTLFNSGPLMNWWTPGEQGFVWYMAISVLLTSVVYPFGTALVWYWKGSVQ